MSPDAATIVSPSSKCSSLLTPFGRGSGIVPELKRPSHVQPLGCFFWDQLDRTYIETLGSGGPRQCLAMYVPGAKPGISPKPRCRHRVLSESSNPWTPLPACTNIFESLSCQNPPLNRCFIRLTLQSLIAISRLGEW